MQYLYVIKCQEFYKIGIANDVKSRLVQLSTGNPFSLEVQKVYGFEAADVVERAIHQKYKAKRQRGEWFSLSDEDLRNIDSNCISLGAVVEEFFWKSVTQDEIQSADEVQDEIFRGDKWDYVSMFEDGWRMEQMNENGKPRNWAWRRGRGFFRVTVYGGPLDSLPYSVENMRRVYRDGLDPVP